MTNHTIANLSNPPHYKQMTFEFVVCQHKALKHVSLKYTLVSVKYQNKQCCDFCNGYLCPLICHLQVLLKSFQIYVLY